MLVDVRTLVGGWVGRVAVRQIRRKGIDLSRVAFIPEPSKVPLQRIGTDPIPRIAELRRSAPLYRLPMPFVDFRVWLVTGHQESRVVLTDRDSYSNDIRHLFNGDGPATSDDIGGLGFTDPPLHTRLRKIVTPEFTMRRLTRLVPIIEDIVDGQLDEMEALGSPADLAKHLAFPVPFQTICALLGLDYEDRDAFAKLGSARFDAALGGAAAFGAVSEQREFLFDAVARQRQAPGPGLLGQIIREQGDAMSDVDLVGLADGVFTGGFETTAGMIALGTIVLLRDPEHAALIRDGSPVEVDRVVDELLRYLSVVQVAFPRFAKQDMELFGRQIHKGDVLLASLSGANRDGVAAGADPEGFDPFRVPPSAHLAFGHGIHRCIGAELAKIELRTVLPRLLRRFPDLALAKPADELNFRRLSFVYGVEDLPVRF
ncbi:MAG: cytochrome P450 [Aeromicrobium sp.]